MRTIKSATTPLRRVPPPLRRAAHRPGLRKMGVQGVIFQDFEGFMRGRLQRNAFRWGSHSEQCIAVCHDVVGVTLILSLEQAHSNLSGIFTSRVLRRGAVLESAFALK